MQNTVSIYGRLCPRSTQDSGKTLNPLAVAFNYNLDACIMHLLNYSIIVMTQAYQKHFPQQALINARHTLFHAN